MKGSVGLSNTPEKREGFVNSEGKIFTRSYPIDRMCVELGDASKSKKLRQTARSVSSARSKQPKKSTTHRDRVYSTSSSASSPSCPSLINLSTSPAHSISRPSPSMNRLSLSSSARTSCQRASISSALASENRAASSAGDADDARTAC